MWAKKDAPSPCCDTGCTRVVPVQQPRASGRAGVPFGVDDRAPLKLVLEKGRGSSKVHGREEGDGEGVKMRNGESGK